ncbi:hypothetical protein JNE51_004426 [Salmonella enterica]|nr:hypothetical protein [Salmonella enterica]
MAKHNPTPPPDELRDRLIYRDGDLWWNPCYQNPNVDYDRPVGFVNKHGNKQVRISVDGVGRCYKVHRLIWWIVNYEWPDGEIDHIDRNPLNNHIDNLRVVDHRTNCNNRGTYSTNTTGYTGTFQTKGGLWGFQISINKKRFNVTGYTHKETAALARDVMARLFYGDHCDLNLLDKNIRFSDG